MDDYFEGNFGSVHNELEQHDLDDMDSHYAGLDNNKKKRPTN